MTCSPVNFPPLIETVAVVDMHVSGMCQFDRMGPDCAITYCVLRADPTINGGKIFRTPVVRISHAVENLIRQRGLVSRWIESGPQEGSLLVPLYPGAGDTDVVWPYRH